MDNDKRTGSGSKWFLFIESLRGLMNSRISTEYVSIESGRDHVLLIVIFQKFYKFPYSFLYYLNAIMDEMSKRGRHLVQYFCQCVCLFQEKRKLFLSSRHSSPNCEETFLFAQSEITFRFSSSSPL